MAAPNLSLQIWTKQFPIRIAKKKKKNNNIEEKEIRIKRLGTELLQLKLI